MKDFRLDNGNVCVSVAEDGSRLSVSSRRSGWRYEATDYAAFVYGDIYFFSLPDHATAHVSQDGEAIRIVFDEMNYWARFPENGFRKPKDGPDLRFDFQIRLEDDEAVFSIVGVQGMDDEELRVSFPYRPLRWTQQRSAQLVMGSFGFGCLVPFPGQPRFVTRRRTETLPLYGIYDGDGGLAVRYGDAFDAWTEYSFTDADCHVNTEYDFIPGLAEYPRTLRMAFMAPGENYVSLAKYYRRHRRMEGGLWLLKDKIAQNPEVGKLPGSVIWKHNVYWTKTLPEGVAHDYSLYVQDKKAGDCEGLPNNWTAREVFDTAHARGFDRVCILNTGWNRYGFDCGYPTRFPVNPARGTADDFRACAEYGRTLSQDYILSVHDNYRDCYRNSPEFSFDEMFRTADGAPVRGGIWHGGRCHLMCPQVALKYARRDLPEIAKLSGRGCIYIDVMGCTNFLACHHPDHPGSGRDDAMGRLAILREAKTHFGAVATESSPSDFCLQYVDIGAYANIKFWNGALNTTPIPLWQLVYHDCVMNFCAVGHCGVTGSAFKNYEALFALLPAGFDDDSLRVSRELRSTCLEEMLTHEFLDGDRQRTVFSNGTEIVADFSVKDGRGHYTIKRH